MSGVLLVVLLLTSGTGGLAPLGARAGAVASPIPAESEAGSLAAMLGRLPDRPLGLDGAMVTYADVARQTAALGVARAAEPPAMRRVRNGGLRPLCH